MAKSNVAHLPVGDGSSKEDESPPTRNRVVGWVHSVTANLPGLLLWTFFPGLVAIVAYAAGWYFQIAALTEPATWALVKSDPRIAWVLVGQLLTGGPWGYLNVKYVRQPETKVWQLRSEVSTSIVMAYVWLIGIGYMVGTGNWYIVVLIPAVIQALDGRQSAIEAINNAAQKMRMDESGSTR